MLREGGKLKVTRLDRLSRSMLPLVTLGADLRERGIGLHVIEKGINHRPWEELGWPRVGRYGLTVTPGGIAVWVDSPAITVGAR
ncbi:recombinase family protein [Streptomyces sp. NPDC054849]